MNPPNIDTVVINKNTVLKEALSKLDQTGYKILFVVNDDRTLYGSLTDGDVRRWILSGGNLDSTIDKACNLNPHTLDLDYQISNVREIMIRENIVSIPVLGPNRTIHSLLFWNDIFSENEMKSGGRSIDIPAVIMAGGKGKRMEPFTRVLPKPLIPIGDKTIIECIIDEFRKYDVKQFYLMLNFKGAMIEAYFNGDVRPYHVDYLHETDYCGTAGSLTMLRGTIHGDFIVSNCDTIVKADYYDILDFHRKNKSYLTVLSSLQSYIIPYGIVSFKEGGAVTEIVEKPEYSFTINSGVYILNEKALEFIPENSLFHMTQLVEALIQQKKRVMTYPVNENDYIDIGQWEEYRKAVEKLKL